MYIVKTFGIKKLTRSCHLRVFLFPLLKTFVLVNLLFLPCSLAQTGKGLLVIWRGEKLVRKGVQDADFDQRVSWTCQPGTGADLGFTSYVRPRKKLARRETSKIELWQKYATRSATGDYESFQQNLHGVEIRLYASQGLSREGEHFISS